MKSKIQTLLGLAVIVFILFGIFKGVYKRNVDDFIEVVKKPDNPIKPINNALFWIEEELEKVGGYDSAKVAQEADQVYPVLFENLKSNGLVNEKIKTLSPYAVKELIRLDAYRGSERDVWEIAKNTNTPYLFKVKITKASIQGTNLREVNFLFSLFDVKKNTVIWEAKAQRISGFFSGRTPEAKKLVDNTITLLKESGIID